MREFFSELKWEKDFFSQDIQTILWWSFIIIHRRKLVVDPSALNSNESQRQEVEAWTKTWISSVSHIALKAYRGHRNGFLRTCLCYVCVCMMCACKDELLMLCWPAQQEADKIPAERSLRGWLFGLKSDGLTAAEKILAPGKRSNLTEEETEEW